MELNDKMMQVLKNFAGINSSIVINQGNQIKTISEARNVIGIGQLIRSFLSRLVYMILTSS